MEGPIAVYPGTFDPITNGHVDLIERSVKMFSKLIVAVGNNPEKRPLFSFEERKAFIEEAVAGLANVEVAAIDTLLVDFMRSRGARVIVRGIRAFSDFEYEYQMAMMNRNLDEGIETVFMIPNSKYSYVSSRLIKEVVGLKGDVSDLVPPFVYEGLQKRLHG